MTTSADRPHDIAQLDALTGGVFTAPTSGERAARVRDWLAKDPAQPLMQQVFKELSARDKGAARAVRERLDEQKRASQQDAMAIEWSARAQALIDAPRLNIADALAWQRDAAKAGAPLGRDPLASLKTALVERVRQVEDLQHQAQVQREAAVLLAQRIELLSTKPWRDADAAELVLVADVQHWQDQAAGLAGDARWTSVDAKYPPLLDASKAQLLAVWEAFRAVVAQARAAGADAAAPLPPVPVWADEIRTARGDAPSTTRAGAPADAVAPAGGAAGAPARPPRPKADPAVKERANAAVRESMARLLQETAEGHGKASAGAAAALRAVLKEHGRHIDTSLETEVNAALVAAGELEGWQRWGADRVREELVAKAEALLNRPDGQALGGRKMQETLRTLREQWKQTDQAGTANHALWKRFDEACTKAYQTVEAWLDKIKADAAQNRAQRTALIEEVQAWGQANAASTDWKSVHRALYQFGDRWREAGHLGEKAFAEMQPRWLEAINAAAAPIEAAKQQSVARRQAMIDEAVSLGEAPMLRIDAVRALQQRWQAEAQSVPLDRRFEQKLWDAFRKPIDDAFNKKTAEREQSSAALTERDRAVLDAAKAVEAANASNDAQRIRAAMAALDAALRGQASAAATASQHKDAAAPAAAVQAAMDSMANEGGAMAAPGAAGEGEAQTPAPADGAAPAESASEGEADAAAQQAPVAPPPPPPKPAKPVIAMRGDDRPGMRKSEPAAPGRGGKFGDRKDGPRGPSRDGGRPGGRDAGGMGGMGDRGPRFGDRPDREDRGPRLGDAAFRAQRDAVEHAEAALRKLAAQAHGEVLTQLMTAWEQRDAAQVPASQALGSRVAPAVRSTWSQALGAPAKEGEAAEALLRLEIAAEAPTPAEHLSARRMLQLQLLTRRNDAGPAQTWGQDVAKVLAAPAEPAAARRLQNVLKTLLRTA